VVDKDLERLRAKIDSIDDQIITLLLERLEAAAAVGKIKREHGLPVEDAAREEEILMAIHSRFRGSPCEDRIQKIYREIMSAARSVQ
jgi:monofunctional chorismate mutase